jgi:3-hydroxyacyl-[acyl-carrier-protein] dehydratase
VSTELPTPRELLPHREPFLFVDRLTGLEPGHSVSGQWTLTGDEDFFAGHFPGRPTLPGVLMVEALAQVGACGLLVEERYQGKLPLFGGAEKVRFRRQVVPGDVLDLEVEMIRLGARAGKASGKASVGGETACEAAITFVLVDIE